jgi:hypothetical protein
MRDGWADWRRLDRKRGWLLAGAGLLLVLVLGRDWLSERLVPDPRLNRQLEQAQAALAAGRLTSSRELFESVLAADPDQIAARQGLIAVRDAAVADAQRALDLRQTAHARARLGLAEALAAPSVQLQTLRSRLRDQEEAAGSAPRLLAEATAPGVEEAAALALLARAVRVEPDNPAVLAARGDLLSRRLRRAEAALARDELATAQALVDGVVAVDPAHVDLPPVQARLGEVLARRQAAQSRELAQAQADERRGRVDRAAARYLALRDGGGDAAAAQAGLDRLATRMAADAQRQAADFRFRAAEASLDKARRWSPSLDAVSVAEQRVRASRLADRRLRRPPTRAERRQVAGLLAQSAEAMDRGEYLAPPGASAWDKLRAATAIAPAAPEVAAARRALGQRSTGCFEEALAGNQLRRAQECLEASQSVDPGREGLAEDRRRLAERWIGRAEERLGASDFEASEAALGAARRWQPGHARLGDLGERLRRARGTP